MRNNGQQQNREREKNLNDSSQICFVSGIEGTHRVSNVVMVQKSTKNLYIYPFVRLNDEYEKHFVEFTNYKKFGMCSVVVASDVICLLLLGIFCVEIFSQIAGCRMRSKLLFLSDNCTMDAQIRFDTRTVGYKY